jgi:hypothetical protein
MAPDLIATWTAVLLGCTLAGALGFIVGGWRAQS